MRSLNVKYKHTFRFPIEQNNGIRYCLDTLERQLISAALTKSANNRSQAARLLNVNRTTLMAAMRRLGVRRKQPQL